MQSVLNLKKIYANVIPYQLYNDTPQVALNSYL